MEDEFEGAPADGEMPSEAHAYAMWKPSDVERGFDRISIAVVMFIVLSAAGIFRVDPSTGLRASLSFLGMGVVAVAARLLQRSADDARTRGAWQVVRWLSVVSFIAGAYAMADLRAAVYVLVVIAAAATAVAMVDALTVQCDVLSPDLADEWRRANPVTYALISTSALVLIAGIVVTVRYATPELDVPRESGWRFNAPSPGSALMIAGAVIGVWAFARCVKPFRAMRVAAMDLRVPVV